MVRLASLPLAGPDLTALRALVARDGLVVVPTDTVYGIGASPTSPAAIAALLSAKGRDLAMPPPVLVADDAQRAALTSAWPGPARILAEKWWPGALTLVVPARADALGWDPAPIGGTLAVRQPDHDGLRDVLRAIGPLAVTSANQHGLPPATCIDEAVGAFGQRAGLYLDGGPTPGAVPSTIVAVEPDGAWRILREGVVSANEIADTLAGWA